MTCAASRRRATMSDDEFWQDVADSLSPSPPGWSEDDDPAPEVDPQFATLPCPVCGSSGACGYDSEGRALIHADGGNNDED